MSDKSNPISNPAIQSKSRFSKAHGDKKDVIERPIRFESHALCEVKMSKWNPFSTVSAVLLDLSIAGFKLEFVNPVDMEVGKDYQLSIPLAPFRIMSPAKLSLTINVKWFLKREMRAGGIFKEISPQQSYFLEQIISHIIGNVDENGGGDKNKSAS